MEDYVLGKQELPLFPLGRYVHVQINRREKNLQPASLLAQGVQAF